MDGRSVFTIPKIRGRCFCWTKMVRLHKSMRWRSWMQSISIHSSVSPIAFRLRRDTRILFRHCTHTCSQIQLCRQRYSSGIRFWLCIREENQQASGSHSSRRSIFVIDRKIALLRSESVKLNTSCCLKMSWLAERPIDRCNSLWITRGTTYLCSHQLHIKNAYSPSSSHHPPEKEGICFPLHIVYAGILCFGSLVPWTIDGGFLEHTGCFVDECRSDVLEHFPKFRISWRIDKLLNAVQRGKIIDCILLANSYFHSGNYKQRSILNIKITFRYSSTFCRQCYWYEPVNIWLYSKGEFIGRSTHRWWELANSNEPWLDLVVVWKYMLFTCRAHWSDDQVSSRLSAAHLETKLRVSKG